MRRLRTGHVKRIRMPSLTRRDVAVLILFAALVAAVVVFSSLGLMRWALASIGVLVGAAAMLAVVQFVVRRSTFDVLRSANREARKSSVKISHLAAAGIQRTEALTARVDALAAREDALTTYADALTARTDALTVRDDALVARENALNADLRDAVREARSVIADEAKSAADGTATILVEMASLRAELRGVRVAQQLFTRSLAQAQNQLTSVALQLEPSGSSDGVGSTGTAPVVVSPTAIEDASAVKQIVSQLRPTIGSLEWQIRRQRADIISDFQAMAQLLGRFTPDAPLPPVAGWALSPAGLLMLTDTIIKHGAELVVECGSGSSTLWMALAMRETGRGKVVALEHLPEYAKKTQELLDAHGVAPWAEVRVAPLTSVATPQGEFQWYETTGMSWDRPIDMLLVDGPPTKTGPHARYPALALLGEQLRAGATIVIDDTERQDESEVIRIWEQEHPQLIARTSPGPGIEVFSFGESTSR